MIKEFFLFHFVFAFFSVLAPLSLAADASTKGAAVAVSGDGDGEAACSGSLTRLTASVPVQSIDIVNPCSDFGFKRAFKDREVAIGFLNTILNLRDDDAIVDLGYIDTELPSLIPEGRDFRVDVLCRSSKGEWFLLEMQNDYRADYPDKALVEFCRLMGHVDAARYQSCSRPEAHELPGGGRGDGDGGGSGSGGGAADSAEPSRKRIPIFKDFWKHIPRIITLVITNKEFSTGQTKDRFPDQALMEPDIVNTYTIRHTGVPARCLGNIDARIVLVMLANFRKPIEDLGSDMDRWLFALKDETMKTGRQKLEMYRHVDSLETVQGDSPALKRFYHLLNKGCIAVDELRRYAEGIQDVNRAFDRQFASGVEQGKREGLLQAARGMKKAKIPNDVIAQSTGLPIDEIDALKADEE
jgi:hypothetical protein